MTEKHRKVADDIVNKLKAKSSVSRLEIHKKGRESHEVVKWLTQFEIIETHSFGYTTGKYFLCLVLK